MKTHKIGDDRWYEINKLGKRCGLVSYIVESDSVVIPQWWAGETDKPLWFAEEYDKTDEGYFERLNKALMSKSVLFKKAE
jgi:hypothetical protein